MTPLPAVIIQPESRPATKVERLVKWCRDLDGTELRVIHMSKADDAAFCARNSEDQYDRLCAYSLHVAALAMNRKPFIWLEADSIPIKAGWAKALTDEYYRLGKPFMISGDSHPPGDLVGGIGVYGEDTSWFIPYVFTKHGWDRWLIEKAKPMVSFTSLIQHKYGHYEGMHKVRDMEFPRDNATIRDDTVIFHRDPAQTLIPKSNRFLHSGCLGDAIAALATIKQLGGGHLVMTQRGNPRILRGERYESLRPLLERQPYLKSVSWEEEPSYCDYDFTNFRNGHGSSDCLAVSQARCVGVHDLNLSPWLEADPSPYSKGRVVIARSARYQNQNFPWLRLLTENHGRALFVGTKEEHHAFQVIWGFHIEHKETANLLEVAELIRGADLFIGNQSSPFWIAAALGVPLVQEVCKHQPDSVIPRPNASYLY